ncbi:MAG TPA: hypothetical protein VJV23_09075 [Candidatus Polarisedimenticolia bacterium]|nr:hypothetical protein [Candidatus Polarisedimenticolia bacterium]
MRELAAHPGDFTGVAVIDPASYRDDGLARSEEHGGLVFEVREVGSDSANLALYQLFKAALAQMNAEELDRAFGFPRDEAKLREQRAAAAQEAMTGLRHSAYDPDLLSIAIRNLILLNECDGVVPYIERLVQVDRELWRVLSRGDIRLSACNDRLQSVPK